MTDEELRGWMTDWQQQGGSLPPDLAHRAKREARAQKRAATFEVLGSIFLLAFAGWAVLRHPYPVMAFFAVSAGGYVGVWLTYLFLVRAGTWAESARSIEEWSALARRRREADVRWARFGVRCMVAVLAFLAVLFPWMLATKWAMYRAEPWRALVGYGVALLILAFVWVRTRAKLRRAEGELAAFERELRR